MSVYAQDTLRYDSIIASSNGQNVKAKYRSMVTGSKQFIFLKKGKWQHFTTDGSLVKEVHYAVNKKDRRYYKHGTELYLNPYTGDSILARTYHKGLLKNQQAFMPAIIKEKGKVLHVYKDFFSFSIEEYDQSDLNRNKTDFVIVWQSSFEDPAFVKQLEEYYLIEEELGDSSLLSVSNHRPLSQYNYVANSTFEYHPKAPFSIMSFKHQMPHWEPASESPDLFINQEFARSGEAFLGFRVFSMQKHIEYLQNKLKAPLTKDSIYCFTAYLKLSPGSKYATNAIGIQFTKEKNYIDTDQLIGVQADIKLKDQLLVYKNSWMKIQCSYTAKGGEQYLTIGSFTDHRSLMLKDIGGQNPESYYYLDDLSLVPIEQEEDCQCNFAKSEAVRVDHQVDPEMEELLQLEIGAQLVLEDIHFEHDKSDLLPSSFKSLNNLLMLMEKKDQLSIEISGHTSSVGAYKHNVNLSAKRAEAVRKFLILNGIEVERIEVKGHGPDFPIADNSTEEGQALNRRVELKILSY